MKNYGTSSEGKKVIVTETQEEFNKLMEIIDETTYFRWGFWCPN